MDRLAQIFSLICGYSFQPVCDQTCTRSTQSLFTRSAVCPHTNCCVKSRWRLIRITPVDVSALRHTVCTGKHGPAVALAPAVNAELHVPLVLQFQSLLVLVGELVSGLVSDCRRLVFTRLLCFLLLSPDFGSKVGPLTPPLPPPRPAKPVTVTRLFLQDQCLLAY